MNQTLTHSSPSITDPLLHQATPFKRVPGTCHASAPTVEQCFKDLEAANNKEYGFDVMRIGVNVVPMIASTTINPLYTDRSDGASSAIPWESDRCMAGGPLDLKGTVTRSDDEWEKEWKGRKTDVADTACGGTMTPPPAPTSVGWAAGLSGPATGRTMDVMNGETIQFTWSGGHNVYSMKDKAAFDACDFSTAIELGTNSGVRHTMGVYNGHPYTDTAYFACKVGTHCASGQKLSAVITAVGSGKASTVKVLTLKEAVQQCSGDADKPTQCIGVALHNGRYQACTSTKAAVGSMFYSKASMYKPTKGDLDTVRDAAYDDHVVTVSFQPDGAGVTLPAKHMADTGEMFGAKTMNGQTHSYGWTGCKHKYYSSLKDYDGAKYPTATVDNTFAWYPSAVSYHIHTLPYHIEDPHAVAAGCFDLCLPIGIICLSVKGLSDPRDPSCTAAFMCCVSVWCGCVREMMCLYFVAWHRPGPLVIPSCIICVEGCFRWYQCLPLNLNTVACSAPSPSCAPTPWPTKRRAPPGARSLAIVLLVGKDRETSKGTRTSRRNSVRGTSGRSPCPMAGTRS